ncbi:MAG: SpoIIE family protein phosphatase [Anaerolineales bacterium]|nr:SpoIIE family protein phosphatase [Anaerolineales bacterium]
MSDSSVYRLDTLYQVTQALGTTLDLDALLNVVIDQVIAVTGAERGFLMLGEASTDMAIRVARGMDRQTIEAPEFQVSRGVVDRVATEGEPLLTSDAQSDAWLSERASVFDLKLRSIMCTPLQTQGVSIGLVYVDNRMHTGIFTEADLELLQAVANTAAVAIENARLHKLAIEQARMEQELEVARQVQTSLIPLEAPKVRGFEISGVWRAAREVAGDFYDFIPRDNGQLAIVIGDVTDKGVPAAFFMALARTTVRASIVGDVPGAAGLTQSNRLICADAASGMFVTLYYLALRPETPHVTCVSAGHNPPLWLHAKSGEISALAGGSLPFGIDADQVYVEVSETLEVNDSILLYTDGIIDAMNERSEFFGLERLMEAFRDHQDASVEEMLNGVQGAVDAFAGDTPPFDDLTLVAVRYVG